MKIKTLAILVGLFFVSQAKAQNYIGNADDVNAILSKIKSFSTYVMNSNYENIANAYSSDGKIFPNNKSIITGKNDIKKYWTLPDGVKTSYHKITPSEIKIIGDEAYDYGYYNGTTLRKNGTTSNWKGKYVIVWRKIDGDWKIYLDIWNSVK